MKTFDEAFHAILAVKSDTLEKELQSTELAVNVASSRELANELRDNGKLDAYFDAVVIAIACDPRYGTEEADRMASMLFTVFLTGVRIGQEMEKE